MKLHRYYPQATTPNKTCLNKWERNAVAYNPFRNGYTQESPVHFDPAA